MASNPPGECCINGTIHEGATKGERTQYAGVDTYIAYPPSKSTEKVILFLTDILGFYNNSKLLADEFAANGYLVVMPDIFDKDQVPEVRQEGFKLDDWLAKENHQPEFVQAVVDKTLAEIKKGFNPKKIGAVGYCFGGKYTIRLLNGHIDAGYTAHPSFVTLEEVAAIKAPLSIAAAESDRIFTTELRHQTEAKLAEIKATYQISLFGGMEHGFSMRSNLKDPKQKFAKEQAFHQAVSWFNEYLS
jgi:dienelactone hydrolase